jgi:hypothetical protein
MKHKIIIVIIFVTGLSLIGCGKQSVEPKDEPKSEPQWVLLKEDDNEPFSRDLNKVYVKSSSTSLEFRVKVNGVWNDPRSINGGINCAIFLDTDRNSNTGLKPDKSYWLYQVNDIGPDYAVIVGIEGDSLWRWDSNKKDWKNLTAPKYLKIETDSDSFEVGINVQDIGSPSLIDIVVSNITYIEPDTSYRDWLPNTGHITYQISGLGKRQPYLVKYSNDVGILNFSAGKKYFWRKNE